MLVALKVSSNIIYNHNEHEVLDTHQLGEIFTRRQKYWEDGSKITVFIKPINSVEHKFFVFNWLRMTHNAYKTKLERETYSGNSIGLIEVKSDVDMLIRVANTQDSIGYIDNKLLIRGVKNVKIITDPQ